MKFNINKKYLYIGITSFLVIVFSIIFYYLLFHGDRFSSQIRSFVRIASPVLYGVIFAYLLTPVVNGLERRFLVPLFAKRSDPKKLKIRKYIRMISVTFTMVLVILIVYGFFSIVIPQLVKSVKSISYQFPYYVQNLTQWSTKFFADNPDIEKLVLQVLDTYSEEINKFLNNNIVPQMEALLKTVSLSMIGLLQSLWNLIIGAIISIYVLFSKEVFAGQAKKISYALFTNKNANQLIKDVRFTSQTFIGFISGKIIDSIIIGFICFAGTSLLNIPYAVLVSVIVGITNIVPFFGPYLGAVPSTILILMVNPIKALYFIIFIFILQQFDGNFLGPKILGQSTGLSGFWVIFSITIFGGLWGILGMIIGVPLFAVLYALAKRIIERMLKQKKLPSTTNEYLNVKIIEDDIFIQNDIVNKKKSFFTFNFKGNRKNSPDDLMDQEDQEQEHIFTDSDDAQTKPYDTNERGR